MVNDPAAARAYHQRSKHTVESVGRNTHRLLWEIQPLPFKIYPRLDPIALPRSAGRVPCSTLDAIAAGPGDSVRAIDVATLARLLHYSAGVTKERVYGDRRIYFRAAPCTGALYHVDVYVVCGEIAGGAGADGLPAGVYHFGPHDFSLRRLRAGDYRSAVIAATAEAPSVCRAAAVLVLASTFWRNAWKYQARAYRHCWWDSGTMLAQLLAVAAAERLPAQVVMGFVDGDIHALLGLDDRREAALALVSLGDDPRSERPTVNDVQPLDLETIALSSREVEYPEIRNMHASSSLPDAASVRRWREHGHAYSTAATEQARAPMRERDAGAQSINLPRMIDVPDAPLDRTIVRRGSTRCFAQAAIPAAALGTMLERSLMPVSFDARIAGASAFDDAYLILHAVDGVAPGAYAVVAGAEARSLSESPPPTATAVLGQQTAFAPLVAEAPPRIDLLRAGSFRREAGFLGLGQDIPADAAANVYLLSALDPLLDVYGARGYRLAQLEAAIHGGRLYLAAYALGLGASGLTFFDDDVTTFFSPHAESKSVMFLVAFGVARKRGMTVT